jgi:hypothetical protein
MVRGCELERTRSKARSRSKARERQRQRAEPALSEVEGSARSTRGCSPQASRGSVTKSEQNGGISASGDGVRRGVDACESARIAPWNQHEALFVKRNKKRVGQKFLPAAIKSNSV